MFTMLLNVFQFVKSPIFGKLVNLIKGNKKWVAIIILFALASGYVWYLNHKITTLEQTNLSLTSANNTLKENYKAIANGLDSVRDSLTTVNQFSEQQKKLFEELGFIVKEQTGILDNKLDKLKNTPIPVTCDGTIDYLIDSVKEFK